MIPPAHCFIVHTQTPISRPLAALPRSGWVGKSSGMYGTGFEEIGALDGVSGFSHDNVFVASSGQFVWYQVDMISEITVSYSKYLIGK